MAPGSEQRQGQAAWALPDPRLRGGSQGPARPVRDQASWEAEASAQDLAATRLMLIGKALEQYWQLAYLGSAITSASSSSPTMSVPSS